MLEKASLRHPGVCGVIRRSPRISVAIPLYNEAEVLPELLTRLGETLDGLEGGPHEIVLVDDGSADETVEILERAAEEDPRIVVVCLSRNFGHQIAITAALDHVSGDLIIVMDGDLQDPPEAIPQLLARHAEGYDVVYAERASRDGPWYLRAGYYLFYRLIARMSEIRLPLDTGDFALLTRRVVEIMKKAPERQRYLRGLRTWVGFRQTGVPVKRPGRAAGKSKYTPFKLLRLALDGIFAFSIVPLRISMLLGLLAIAASLVFLAYAVYAKIYLDSPQGFTALISAVIFSMGVQLVLLGVVGEYVGRIYEEVKARPHYVVSRVLRRRPDP